MSSVRPVRALAMALAVTLGMSGLTWAQDGDANAHFSQGEDLIKQERWCEAMGAFEASYRLAAEARTLLRLGVTQEKCGRLVEARASFQKFVDDNGRNSTLLSQVTKVKSFLTTLDTRIPQVRLVPKGLEATDELRLDGFPIDDETLANPNAYLALNPGDHEVTVERTTGTAKRERFSIQEGETRTLEFTVPPPCADANGDQKCDEPCVDKNLDGKCDKEGCVDWDDENLVCRDGGATGTGPVDDGGSLFDEPAFWIIAGVVVAAGLAVGAYLIIDGMSEDEKCAASDFGGCFKPATSGSTSNALTAPSPIGSGAGFSF